MFNSTTIGAGLGRSPGRLLAWGLGWTDTTATLAGVIRLTGITFSQPLISNIQMLGG